MIADGAAVYSIVGGVDGAKAISGSVVSQADASNGYQLTGTSWETTDRTRWPIRYRVNPRNSGLSNSQSIAAIQAGLQGWVDDPGSDIRFSYQGTTSSSPSNYSDGVNTIGWVSTPNSADQFLAQAIWVSSSGSTLAFDVRFNRDYAWAAGAQSGRFDIETVALHEAGHIIGLDHTTTSSPRSHVSLNLKQFHEGAWASDRSGAARLYPAPEPVIPDPYVEPFFDVPLDAFYAEAVAWAYEAGVTTGTSPTNFQPNAAVTRGQFALLLYRFAGRPGGVGQHRFSDVPVSGEVADAVSWLQQEAITTGTSGSTFSPDLPVDRAQLAALLWRHAGVAARCCYARHGLL